MTAQTSIEWTQRSWNPIRGCSRISEGCRHCYAEQIAARFSGVGQPYEGLATRSPARWTGKLQFIKKDVCAPFSWKKPQCVFVNSMSDLFHEDVKFDWLVEIFYVMLKATKHTFQILTKRAGVMSQQVPRVMAKLNINDPLTNVWLGVSVEDQKTADERIPLLLQTPAAVRWLSCEPLLGTIDLDGNSDPIRRGVQHWDYFRMSKEKIDWVVVGGESGTGARPMHPDWARSLRDQCTAAGAPFFFKQWGAWWPSENDHSPTIYRGHVWPDGTLALRVGKKNAGRLLDGREWNEFPHGAERLLLEATQ